MRLAGAALLLGGSMVSTVVAAPVTIDNTAYFSYEVPGIPGVPPVQDSPSNTISLGPVIPLDDPAQIRFYQYAKNGCATPASTLVTSAFQDHDYGSYQAGGVFSPLAATPQYFQVDGSGVTLLPVDVSQPLSLCPTDVYHAGESVFISVADANRNHDKTAIETIKVTVTTSTGDQEVLLLRETGPDTGVFVAVLPSTADAAAPADSRLSVAVDGWVRASYVDEDYPGPAISTEALVDPYGALFDASNPALGLSGADIWLIDDNKASGCAALGLDATDAALDACGATVFNDDVGNSPYPAHVKSGVPVSTSGSAPSSVMLLAAPAVPAGSFRYPLVAPGQYHYVVKAPGYTVPSSLVPVGGTAAGRAVVVGSHLQQFVVKPGPALHIDIPADPSQSTMVLTKTVSQTEASAGDYLQYRLQLTNNSPAAPTSTTVTDVLPLGMRYQRGSLHINGVKQADPALSADGRTMTILLAPGLVGAGGAASTPVLMTYVLAVSAGAPVGDAVNTAQASGPTGVGNGTLVSNRAQASVRIRDFLMSSRFTLIGRVFEGDDCSQPFAAQKGVPNVRILMEDGTYVVTDKDGQYHIEGVKPGTHVVQMDTASLPKGWEPVSCIQNTRFAGSAYSQFVEVQGGGLWRADFHVRPAPVAEPVVEAVPEPVIPKGEAGIRLQTLDNVQVTELTRELAPRSYTFYGRFASGQDVLLPESVKQLEKLASDLKKGQVLRLEILGHTDNQALSARTQAKFDDNYGLGLARAKAIADYLAPRLGLGEDQVNTQGIGPDKPLASNSTAAGMAKNRRVEVVVYGGMGPSTAKVGERSRRLHRLLVDSGTVPAFNLRATVMLPPDLSYVKGSSLLDGVPLADPEVMDGMLVWRVPAAAPREKSWEEIQAETEQGRAPAAEPVGWQRVITFNTDVVRKLVTTKPAADRQYTFNGTFEPAQAELMDSSVDELEQLQETLRQAGTIERLEIIGHTDNQKLSARARKRFPDNKALSLARARTIADFLQVGLGLSPDVIVADGHGPDEPVASNASPAGMAQNRRVELKVFTREAAQTRLQRQLCLGGYVSLKATATVDTEAESNVRLPVVENRLDCAGQAGKAKAAPAAATASAVSANMAPQQPAAPAGSAAPASAPAAAGKADEVFLDDIAANDVVPVAAADTSASAAAVKAAVAAAAASHAAAAALAGDGGEEGTAASVASTASTAVGFAAEAAPTTPVPVSDPVPVGAASAANPAVTDTNDSGRQTVVLEPVIPAEPATPAPAATADAAAEKDSDASQADSAEPDDGVAAAGGGDVDWLARTTGKTGFLFPGEKHNPRAPALRVVVEHGLKETVELMVNGEPVPNLNLDGTRRDPGRKAAVSIWRALPLREGANRIVARVRNEDGMVTNELVRIVNYANTPVRAELVPEKSVLVADGLTRPVLAVRLLDRNGQPVREGISGPVTIHAPYMSWQQQQETQRRQLAGLDAFSPQYVVKGDDGIALIELAPTTESGTAQLDFDFFSDRDNRRTQELRAWLEPAAREWVMVGFAEGTVGFNTLKDNVQALKDQGVEEGVYTDGKASFYAKGSVQGKWILTMAYDTSKQRDRQSLLSTIDPNEFYTLYGDGAEQRYDAASQSKLYLKLERGQFYALFGDYDTGLGQTQLSTYNRTLNGIKTEKAGGLVVFTAYAAETQQTHARDEIRGNGTSGLYRLSRNNLVLNTEQVRIETRDRLHSQTIIDSRPLTRHLDYDIDYSAGTLFFKQPVYSQDVNFNPTWIVVDYETQGTATNATNAGGRVGLNLLEGKLEVGVTALHDESGDSTVGGKSDLLGTDLKYRFDMDSELRLEMAGSSGEQAGTSRDGKAWLAELERHTGRYDLLLYMRDQEPEFGLNQQSLSEAGQQKIGMNTTVHLDREWSVQGELYQQQNQTTDSTRDAASAKLHYETQQGSVSIGVQTVNDSTDNVASGLAGQDFSSQQLALSANRWFMKRKLQLSADAEMGKSESADYPNRFVLGAGYAFTDHVKLLAGQEFTDGSDLKTSNTRVGMQVVPWKGARLDSTLNQSQMSEYGPRTFAQFGLAQTLQVDKAWGVDFGLDSSQGIGGAKPAPEINNSQATSNALGLGTSRVTALTEDYLALTSGLTYRADIWSWTGRAEYRNGETEDRYGFTSNFLRQAREGVAFATGTQAFRTTNATSTGNLASLDLSWAWRPLGTQWSVLDRLEFKYEDAENTTALATPLPGGLFGFDSLVANSAQSRRIINNLALNHVSREWTQDDRSGNLFRRYERNQWSLYYGAKYAMDTFDGEAYNGYTDMIAAEVRHDLRSWLDIGLQASTLNSWSTGTRSYSFGPQIGASPVKNGWITLGWNLRGFTDRDFDAARYSAQGPYLQLRIKFDQNTRLNRDMVAPNPAMSDEPLSTAKE